MSIVIKEKIKIDNNFINDLITKSWEECEGIQSQIDSIEIDSEVAAKTVKLLRDLLTSYYVFTGCLENLDSKPIEVVNPVKATELEVVAPERLAAIQEEPKKSNIQDIDILSELDADIEPFEYFVDFDEPTGKPLTDKDLYG